MKPQLPSNSCQSQKEGDSSGHSPFCLGAFVTDVASCCQSIETKKREILSLYTFIKALAIVNKGGPRNQQIMSSRNKTA